MNFKSVEEELEGLQTISSDGWGDYPLDSVFVRTEARTVRYVVDRINAKRYQLDPDYQRNFLWSTRKQSKLIESCIMRIPLPVFYVAEAPDGKIIVVDGLQRLTTFVRFLGNKLKLTGLASENAEKTEHPLEGKYFKDLSIGLQERVEDTGLTMYILDAKAPERARLDIFERVNSGEPLTRQQMRNALYNGAGTRWLAEAAAGAPFLKTTGRSLNKNTMRDREAINRFCAFRLLGWRNYTTGDLDRFLADSLLKMNSMSTDELDNLRKEFDHSMLLNHELFQKHAFRKSLVYRHPTRSVINISLFEVCSVAFTELKSSDLHVKQQIIDLVVDPDFEESITYSTNSTKAVRTRFQMMEDEIDVVC